MDFIYQYGEVCIGGFYIPVLFLGVIGACLFILLFTVILMVMRNGKMNAVRSKAKEKKDIPKPTDVKNVANERKIINKEEKKILLQKKKELNRQIREMEQRRHQKSKLAISSQETIPYLVDYDDGLFEIAEKKDKKIYSKTIVFEDINYSTLKLEDATNIFFRYTDLINRIPAGSTFELVVDNTRVDVDKYREDIKIPYRNDGLDELRDEMNSIQDNVILGGNSRLEKKRSLTIALEADNSVNAMQSFSRLDGDLLQAFKRIGSKAHWLGTMERHEQLHDIFRPDEVGAFNKHGQINFEQFKKWKISMKDYICPDGWDFRANYFMMGDKYAQTMFVLDFPASMSDRFLNTLTDVPFYTRVAITNTPLLMHEGVKMVNKAILGMESDRQKQESANIKAGYSPDMIHHELRDGLENAEDLRAELTKNNQKMFLLSVVIMHVADSLEELNNQKKTIQEIGSQFLCQIRVLTNQQEKGMQQSLPLGHNVLNISTTATSKQVAVLIPFFSQELNMKNGFFYGMNATSKNPIFFDRVKGLINGNGFILGASGSGKSFSAKEEIGNILLTTDDDVIVIDPDGEYSAYAEQMHGISEIIDISVNSQNYINPMDLNKDYEGDKGDPVIAKTDFIVSVIETAIGDPEYGITARERSILDKAVRMSYKDLVDHDYNPEYVPTWKDLRDILKGLSYESSVAGGMAEALEIFADGSLSIFSHHTNVDFDKRLAVYNTSKLGRVGSQMNTLGSLIMLDAVWQRVLLNRARGRRTWVYVDEFTVLTRIQSSKLFFTDCFKRIRKAKGCATGLTQNITSLFRDADTMEMLANAEFVLMLNQSATDRIQLAEIMQLSETQLEYVTDAEKGHGLMKAGRYVIPFINNFPKDTKLYRAMTTDPDERNEIDGTAV